MLSRETGGRDHNQPLWVHVEAVVGFLGAHNREAAATMDDGGHVHQNIMLNRRVKHQQHVPLRGGVHPKVDIAGHGEQGGLDERGRARSWCAIVDGGVGDARGELRVAGGHP